MDQPTPQGDKEKRNPLIPLQSIMEWKPPSETVAAVVHLAGEMKNQLQNYKQLCGKEYQ